MIIWYFLYMTTDERGYLYTEIDLINSEEKTFFTIVIYIKSNIRVSIRLSCKQFLKTLFLLSLFIGFFPHSFFPYLMTSFEILYLQDCDGRKGNYKESWLYSNKSWQQTANVQFLVRFDSSQLSIFGSNCHLWRNKNFLLSI